VTEKICAIELDADGTRVAPETIAASADQFLQKEDCLTTPALTSSQTKKQSTGINGLDHLLGGGLPANRLFVVEGSPGSGKTTLAMQFLLEGLRQGQTCLYVTLSETFEELNDVAVSHGWNLQGMRILELNSIAEWLDQDANYTVYHPSDVELGETVQRIRREIEDANPERVVLDSVSEMKILAQTNVRYRRELLGLKQFFAGRNCTVLVLDDCTSGESEKQLQSLAHGVIRLERESREYATTKRQLHIVKMRGVRFLDGRHDFAVNTGGIEVFPRLTAHGFPVVPHTGTVESGSPEMDRLLGGGLDRGSSALLVGPAGSGKTTLSSMFILSALQRGEKVNCYLFEESDETFLRRAAGLGMDFMPFLESGAFELVQINIAELAPGEFSASIRTAVEKRGVSVVTIDSLNGYLNGMPSERFLMIHMHELLAYLGRKGIVTLLTVAQHGMMGSSMQAPVDLSFLADTVVLLRFFEALGTVKQAISVVKKRRSGHERTLRELKIGIGGPQIGEVLRDFQGVLTGVPQFVGDKKRLLAGPGGK
jgi:circadian clock protein KaiC